MGSAAAARMWMLLQSERSLGLESVRWKVAATVKTTKATAGAPVVPAMVPARPAAMARALPPQSLAPVATNTPAGPVLPPRGVQPVEALQNMRAVGEAAILPLQERISLMESLNANHVRGCTKCRLHETRKNTVFGEGALDAELMFIGEGPGESEDETGRPFVGGRASCWRT